MTTADEYADLPEWIRPGAKLAALGGGYLFVTVARITRTQIVAFDDSNQNADYRFSRDPARVNGQDGQYLLRGAYTTVLVRRDHPTVVSMRIDRIARDAAKEVAELRKTYSDKTGEGDRRNREERALDLLDGIENAARKARRKVEALLNPSTLANAQYQQDLEA